MVLASWYYFLGCDEVEISEYRDLGDKYILTTRPTGNTLEIVDVTLFKDDKAIGGILCFYL